MVYTSYFARLNSLPKDVIPISICGKAPDWYKGLQYKKLAPKYGFFMEWKRTHDNSHYVKCYYEQVLSGLKATEVLQEIKKLAWQAGGSPKSDICLICYEKPTDFCHRHLVAKWLNNSGIRCEEYDLKK